MVVGWPLTSGGSRGQLGLPWVVMTPTTAAPTGLRCAVASEGRGEPLLATASTVTRWLLVESPGPWGASTVPVSRLGPAATVALQATARTLGARLLLIRRPAETARRGEAAAGRRLFFADSRPDHVRLLGRVVTDDAELLAVPTTGWEPQPGPLLLVCAHGKHDVCCALRGRPLAAALARLEPERTWECSHIGGDRFASNSLVLPFGLYYGRLGGDDAAALLAASDRGRVLPAALRGRSCYPPVVQAAQHYARAALEGDGRDGVDDLAPLRQDETGDGSVQVLLDGGAGSVVAVAVRRTARGAPALLTCRADAAAHPPAWDLVELEVRDARA